MSDTTTRGTTTSDLSQERHDLLEALITHRTLFLQTAAGLTDEQANSHSTVSALTIGGLIKHVAAVEKSWAAFAVEGPSAMGGGTWEDVDWSVGPPPEVVAAYEAEFSMAPGDTLADLIAEYETVAAATNELVATLDLDVTHPLPEAPWFEPGASRSVRRVFVHIVAETAQHAGHADIIRESIDGAKTMG